MLVEANERPKRPNVVILMADDLGSGDVGFLGNDTIGTTQIDKLAKNGIILEQHLAPASVCTPSRYVFSTELFEDNFMVLVGYLRISDAL